MMVSFRVTWWIDQCMTSLTQMSVWKSTTFSLVTRWSVVHAMFLIMKKVKMYPLLYSIAYILSVRLCMCSADENQLMFTCHWRCGTASASESPVYELVEIQGTFRKLDTDGCKSGHIYNILLSLCISIALLISTNILVSQPFWCLGTTTSKQKLPVQHQRSASAALLDLNVHKSSGNCHSLMNLKKNSPLGIVWNGSFSFLITGKNLILFKLRYYNYASAIFSVINVQFCLQRASHYRILAIWGARYFRVWLLPPRWPSQGC